MGAIIARPIMVDGVDPVTASAISVGTAALCLIFVGLIPKSSFSLKNSIYSKAHRCDHYQRYFSSGSRQDLLLYGLGLGDVVVVTTLSATTPVLIRPLLWITTGIRPPLMAWVGAIVSLVGIAFITFAWN